MMHVFFQFVCLVCFIVEGYEPSKPGNADEIVNELNEKQDLCLAITKLRMGFKSLLVPNLAAQHNP